MRKDKRQAKKTAKRDFVMKKIKRRKSKNLPKSFIDDGLDYLLDACDSSKIATFEKEILGEETPGEDEDDDSVLRELGLDSGGSESEDIEMDDQDDHDDSEGEQEELQEDDDDEAGDCSDDDEGAADG